jgi:hypothetical protein
MSTLTAAIKADIDRERERLAAREERIQAAMEREREKREARRRLAAEDRGADPLPEPVTLESLLAEPDEDVVYRIAGLQHIDGKNLFAARHKTGKTTVRDNLVRCLADGGQFLGRFTVTPLTGCVVVFDAEMSRRQLKRWLRDQRSRRADRVVILCLRGRLGTFNILDPEVRAAWAAVLRRLRAQYVVLDCLRPFLDALGLDEDKQAGLFLVAFEALLAEAGVREMLVIHHYGHGQDRARGDSRLRDWADSEWNLTLKNGSESDPDPSAPRFFQAFGRDVDVPQHELHYDAETRQLTIAGTSRRDTVTMDALQAVYAVLKAATAPQSGRQIKAALAGEVPRKAIETALQAGCESGDLAVDSGPRGACLYRVSRTVPTVSRNADRECPATLKERDAGTLTNSEAVDRPGGTLNTEGADASRY